MNSVRKTTRLYAIFLGALTVLVGAAFVAELASVYFSGASPLYSYQGVGERMQLLLIPLLCWFAAIAVGFFVGMGEVKTPAGSAPDAQKTYARLRARLPEGEGEEFSALRGRIARFDRMCLGLRLAVLAFGLVAAVFCAVRLFTLANYAGSTVNEVVLSLLGYVAPWFAAVVVLIVFLLVFERFAYRKMLPTMKLLIASGIRGTRETPPAALGILSKTRTVLSDRRTVWGVRAALGALAVLFLVLGACNGGADDVLGKAVMICTECIGLG